MDAMPETPEIDTDKLREAIDEEIEKEGSTLLRTIALTTAILAALAAIAALKAGATANEALILKTETTRLQAEASDQWAYYQAKGLKATITESEKNAWTVLDKPAPEELTKNQERYVEDQRKSKEKAEEFEKQRDEKSAEADHLMHHHHFFAQSVAFLQVSIALGAVAALTRNKAVWLGSTLLGVLGAGVLGYAFLS
jgi:carboxylesterase type B